jgi:hypothetical protein
MSVEDVIESHPLRLLEGRKALPKGEISLMLARHGEGKSAALINFALDEIMKDRKLLHFTVGMPSEKAHHYYQKIFNDNNKRYLSSHNKNWEDIYHHFTVVSYLDAAKMVADLDNEIETILGSTDVEASMIVVDGLDFDANISGQLAELKEVAQKRGIKLLASLSIHRNGVGEVDLDGPFSIAKQYSSHIYYLEPAPEKDRINLELVTEHGNEILPVYFCPHDFVFIPG